MLRSGEIFISHLENLTESDSFSELSSLKSLTVICLFINILLNDTSLKGSIPFSKSNLDTNISFSPSS